MSKRLKNILDATEMIFADESFNVKNNKELLADMPDYEEYIQKSEEIRQRSFDVDVEMLPCWQYALLTRDQEQHLLRKYNYLKSLARTNALQGKIRAAEQFLHLSKEVKEMFALANMRLAVNAIKKIFTQYHEDLLSEAYACILKSVDYFDWRRGVKFSTYTMWAINRNLWRSNKELQKTALAPLPDYDFTARDPGYSKERQSEINKQTVKIVLAKLKDARQRKVLEMRFGIGCNPHTLEEIGKKFKVTKERIRQIEASALMKLHKLAIKKEVVMEELV